jgi:hypothetical protein
MAAKRMRLSSFRQLWLYERTKTMLGHLTHLGDTSEQHAPLVYGGTRVPTRSQHKPWLVFFNHRGWIVHKQSIFLPGSPLEAIPAAFHFIEGYAGGVPLIASTWPAR